MSLKTQKTLLVLHKAFVIFRMEHLWCDLIKHGKESSLFMDVNNLQSFTYRHLLSPHTHTPDLSPRRGHGKCAWDQLQGANWWGLGCILRPNLWLPGQWQNEDIQHPAWETTKYKKRKLDRWKQLGHGYVYRTNSFYCFVHLCVVLCVCESF